MDEPTPPDRKAAGRTWGAWSLAVMVVDFLAMCWMSAAAGDGVDSGLGVALVFLWLGLPVAAGAFIVAVLALFRRSGNVYARLTLAFSPGVLVAGSLWAVFTGTG